MNNLRRLQKTPGRQSSRRLHHRFRPHSLHGEVPVRISQTGFSILELVVSIAILMILAGISAPRLIQAIENERLQSATIAYASFLQQSRYQAEHDQQYYEVLFDTSNPSYTMAYLDLNGNNVYDAGEPEIEIAAPITLPAPLSPAIPAGFGNANLIGATPLPMIAGTPATFNQNGAQQVGLQFNERGLPCQRTSATASCTNVTITNAGPPPTTAPVAWITYFAYPLANGGIAYAAVTITPAGRIKVWNYQAAAGGGGNWV